MSNFFNMIDFCSSGVELRIQGKTRQTSIVGGIVSLLISSAVVFLIIYLGLDIVIKEKPRLIVSETEGSIPTYYNLTANDFMLGFKITNEMNQNVDYTDYLNVFLTNSIGVKKDKISPGESPFKSYDKYYDEFESCNSVPEYSYLNKSSTLQTYTCIKNLSLYLGGDFSDNKYGILDFIVAPCKGRDTCKSPEEISKFVDSGLLFIIYYRDNLVDPKKSDTPIQTTHAPYIIAFANSLKTDPYFYYQNLEVKSDFGFLFEDFKYTYTYKYDYKEANYKSRTGGYYIYGSIFISKKLTTFERRYLKIQEIAADIGGLFKFLWIVGLVFMYPISKKLSNIYLMNELFHFQKYGVEPKNEEFNSSFINLKKKSNNEDVIVNNYPDSQSNNQSEPNQRFKIQTNGNNLNSGFGIERKLKTIKNTKNESSKNTNKNNDASKELVTFTNAVQNQSSTYINSQQNILGSEPDQKSNVLILKSEPHAHQIRSVKEELIKEENNKKSSNKLLNKNNDTPLEIFGKENNGKLSN